ncbi:hypothetical protein PIB30_037843 [Stylosanthes scabra]|uniref:Uncharacterized protein n=1 Tax=Stylosanthes scabra TaxID=79078 RepID=A0ABU6TE21_9FABA|nr:hypothetical protein [Stylosanthes scabra]
MLNLQKVVVEEEKAEAVRAKFKAEEDLNSVEAKLELLEKEKDEEIKRLKRWEMELALETERLCGLLAEENVRADLIEASMSELQKKNEELAGDAKVVVSATEFAHKAQFAILVPDFDSSQIGFFKGIVDGKTFRRFESRLVLAVSSETG